MPIAIEFRLELGSGKAKKKRARRDERCPFPLVLREPLYQPGGKTCNWRSNVTDEDMVLRHDSWGIPMFIWRKRYQLITDAAA